MKQMAEWMHNRTTVQGQVKIVREIAQYIESETNNDCQKYIIAWKITHLVKRHWL